MVVGASQGSAPGVAPIGALKIQKAVLTFNGADRPWCDILRVRCDGTESENLLVLVDPPEPGHGPLTCQKSGDGDLNDGAVFVRFNGEPREARGDELKQLIQRSQNVCAQVDFDLKINGVVRPIGIDDERSLEEYISVHPSRLRMALEHAKNPPNPETASDSLLRKLGPSLSATAKTQATFSAFSEAEFYTSIDTWEQRVRDAWLAATLHLLGGLADPLAIEVTNREQAFFHDVKINVHLAGAGFGVEAWESGDDISTDALEIPDPSCAYGPKASQFGHRGTSLPEYSQSLGSSIHIPSVPLPTRTSWTDSGSVDLEFLVSKLRPKDVDACDHGELVIYTLDRNMTSVQWTWEITARDHLDVNSGSLEVKVGDPLDLTHASRQILGLDGQGW